MGPKTLPDEKLGKPLRTTEPLCSRPIIWPSEWSLIGRCSLEEDQRLSGKWRSNHFMGKRLMNPTPPTGSLDANTVGFFKNISFSFNHAAVAQPSASGSDNKSAGLLFIWASTLQVNRIGGWRDSIRHNYIDLITNYANPPIQKAAVIESTVDTLWETCDTLVVPEALRSGFYTEARRPLPLENST